MDHGVWRRDENHVTLPRAGELGVHWSPLLNEQQILRPNGEQEES